jgi:hypothetical protein
VIDDVVRTIIPAFPPARASKSHLHTPVETSWVERLDEYPIPQNLQVRVDLAIIQLALGVYKP